MVQNENGSKFNHLRPAYEIHEIFLCVLFAGVQWRRKGGEWALAPLKNTEGA